MNVLKEIFGRALISFPNLSDKFKEENVTFLTKNLYKIHVSKITRCVTFLTKNLNKIHVSKITRWGADAFASPSSNYIFLLFVGGHFVVFRKISGLLIGITSRIYVHRICVEHISDGIYSRIFLLVSPSEHSPRWPGSLPRNRTTRPPRKTSHLCQWLSRSPYPCLSCPLPCLSRWPWHRAFRCQRRGGSLWRQSQVGSLCLPSSLYSSLFSSSLSSVCK